MTEPPAPAAGVTYDTFRRLTFFSVLAGLCPLIPVPFLDDWVLARVRRWMVRDLAALRVAAGLSSQARRQEEIALSILSKVVKERRGRRGIAWTEEEPSEDPAMGGESAMDPVCQIEVVIVGSRTPSRMAPPPTTSAVEDAAHGLPKARRGSSAVSQGPNPRS